jgi:Cu(I)/Ag(I) efflux system membrane protein CusA/SilA
LSSTPSKRASRKLRQACRLGVTIVPFYDRSDLIEQAVGTLRTALIEEIALVTLAHVIFLMHFRSILIVTLPLPLAVLMSFLGMYYAGISSNIMSLAGIAIAIGVLVDAGIVGDRERVPIRRAARCRRQRSPRIWETVRDSTRLVGRPVFFSMAIILLAFIPVFALTGQEGKLFTLGLHQDVRGARGDRHRRHARPGALHAAARGEVPSEEANPVMRVLRAVYRPVLQGALAHRALTIAAAAVLFRRSAGAGAWDRERVHAAAQRGRPDVHAHRDPSISLEENTRIAARQNAR